MSYPRNLHFQPVTRVNEAITIGWTVEEGLAVTGFLVFRASRAIADHELEQLYEGQLTDVVATVTIPRTAHTLIDDEWVENAWYAVVAMTADGDLIELSVHAVASETGKMPPGSLRMSTIRAVGPPQHSLCGHGKPTENVYAAPPEMVYRNDKATDTLRLKAIESALARRFDDPSSG